jgi:hypothetical protein
MTNSPFRQVNRQVHEGARSWTIDQAIGYLYSTSCHFADCSMTANLLRGSGCQVRCGR